MMTIDFHAFALLALLGALITTSAAQLLYKLYSRTHKVANLLASMVLFATAPPLTYLAVKALGVGMVYMATGITYAIAVVAGWSLFGERMSARTIIAILLILLGVLIYGYDLR